MNNWQRFAYTGLALILLFSVSFASAVTWTGAGADDNWSTSSNWQDGAAPTAIDPVTFNAGDSGNTNIVDTNFTIIGLEYIGNSVHTTNLSGNQLQVDGPLSVGLGNDGTSATANWIGGGALNIGSPLTPQTLDIGTQNSTTNTGFINTGALTLAEITVNGILNNLYIGRKATGIGGGGGMGTFTVNASSTVNIDGTATTKPNVYIGYNQDNLSGSGGFGSAIGVLDASDAAASVSLHLDELNVGYSQAGVATGTLRWNQSEVIDATSVYFGRGKGATGILDVPAGGTLLLGSSGNRVDNLRIAYDDSTVNATIATTTSADLDFTVNNPTIEAYIGSDLSIGRRATGIGGGTVDGSLTVASNSILDVGTSVDRANVYIGYNQDNLSGSGGFGSAIGVLDASDAAASVSLHLDELNVGYSQAGVATGTLRWNQSEVIDATSVYFGRGKGATGILDVPAGGTLLLGSSGNRVDNLRIAYDDSTVNATIATTTSADLDFTVNNPTIEAYIGSDLSIGRRATGIGGGTVDGSLTVASNSILDVGTSVDRANVYIGYNQDNLSGSGGFGSAIGVLDASDAAASVSLHLDELNVGYSQAGVATGTLRWNQSEVIDATSVYFGRGKGATGILDVPAGGTLLLGSSGNRVDNLRIAYDDSTVNATIATTTSADLDFTVNNPTIEAYIGSDLSIGRRATGIGGGTVDGSLTVASNSILDVGTSVDRANVYIGYNQDNLSGSGGFGSAIGVLDASDAAASVSLHLDELNVGYSQAGVATGTLRWNQSEVIDATSVYFGRGKGATGILDVPAGGTLLLGSSGNRVDNLRIAYDDSTVNATIATTTSADLDFTVNNPTIEAYIGSDLSIGRRATGIGGGTVDGSLTVASNSILDVGTSVDRANVYIGYNQDNLSGSGGFGSAIGVLDASVGNVTMRLNEFNIGRSSAGGLAQGIFTMGATTAVNVNTVNIGAGTNATGTVNMTDGLMTANTINLDEGAFNFTGGRLAVNTFNGTLDQEGGTLAPGVDPDTTSIAGLTTINGDYNLDSAGTLEIELFGTTPGTQYDQVSVFGGVDLDADSGTGATLDLKLSFAPSLNDMFTILDNDGVDPINAFFLGLVEGAQISEVFNEQTVTFIISYVGGTGNDIVLNTVPIPPAFFLFGSGLLGLLAAARQKKCRPSRV